MKVVLALEMLLFILRTLSSFKLRKGESEE